MSDIWNTDEQRKARKRGTNANSGGHSFDFKFPGFVGFHAQFSKPTQRKSHHQSQQHNDFVMANICTAAEWPKAVSNIYEPVGYLGKGGFACVLLGKSKKPVKDKDEEYVAIKIVDGTEDDWAYSHREADILRHLHHPNIMRVVNSWEPNEYEPGAMALSYAKGPTIQALLLHGGALSALFVRVVTAQVADALSYMHSHAVVHRDIKPDSKSCCSCAVSEEEETQIASCSSQIASCSSWLSLSFVHRHYCHWSGCYG